MNRKKQKFEKSESELPSPTPIFGVPLTSEGMEEKTCLFVETCLQFLEDCGLESQQGLFRMCGSKIEIELLREKANAEIYYFRIPPEHEPHTVAGVLKQFFREMPVPLVPFEQYSHFITAAISAELERKENIKNCLTLLPTTNLYILGKLCIFMHKIQLHKATNLMSSDNLSTCIGPNLLRTEGNDPRSMIVDTPAIMSLFSLLIREAPFFFPDLQKLRPHVRKREIRLSHINKQMFTVYLPPMEKKSVIISTREHVVLATILEKICKARGVALEHYVAVDGTGTLVRLDKPLNDIDGRCITLVHNGVDVRKTEDTEEPDQQQDLENSAESQGSVEFLYPLPNGSLINPDLTDKSSNRKSKRTASTSFLPKVWSPFSEKVSPSGTPRTAPSGGSAISSTNSTPRENTPSSTTPKNSLSRKNSRTSCPSLVDSSFPDVCDYVEMGGKKIFGPPPPQYVPAPPRSSEEELVTSPREIRLEKRKSKKQRKSTGRKIKPERTKRQQIPPIPVGPPTAPLVPNRKHTHDSLRRSSTQGQVVDTKSKRRSTKLNLRAGNKENQFPANTPRDIL